MRKKVKVIKKLAAAGLAAILACQVMGCGTGEKPTKDLQFSLVYFLCLQIE